MNAIIGGKKSCYKIYVDFKMKKLVNILLKNHSIHSKELKDHLHLFKSL